MGFCIWPFYVSFDFGERRNYKNDILGKCESAHREMYYSDWPNNERAFFTTRPNLAIENNPFM